MLEVEVCTFVDVPLEIGFCLKRVLQIPNRSVFLRSFILPLDLFFEVGFVVIMLL